MAQIRVLRTTETSNPVGDPVIRSHARDRRDLVSTLVARVRRLIKRSRAQVSRP